MRRNNISGHVYRHQRLFSHNLAFYKNVESVVFDTLIIIQLNQYIHMKISLSYIYDMNFQKMQYVFEI